MNVPSEEEDSLTTPSAVAAPSRAPVVDSETSGTPDEDAPQPSVLGAFVDRHSRHLRVAADVVIVAVCALFVFMQLGPRNIFLDATPAGGDMGAHVWGPAYLRDHLLPSFQLTGWTPDWYAGFPAFQFYMVVPALLIVILDVGVVDLGSVPGSLLLGFSAGAFGVAVGSWHDRRWRVGSLVVGGVALVLVGLPYGVAFKLVAVSGSVLLPVAAYVFGRLARLPFPGPALLAVATLPFLFYRGYSIYGGNLASMLAGEFAFSISLSLGLLYLGVVLRGLETGRHRALAAGLLALTGLCHIIPAFWALLGTVVIVALRHRRTSAPFLPCAVLGGVGGGSLLLGLVAWAGWSPLPSGLTFWSVGLVFLGLVLGGAGVWLFSHNVRWLAPVVVVGGLLSSFWVMPFVLRADFVNDMGWEKLGEGPGSVWSRWSPHLLPSSPAEEDLRWVFVLALVGAVLSVILRVRAGIFLAVMTVAAGLAFIWMPEGRLWNGRILPFYYLSAMLLALLAVALLVMMLGRILGPRPVLVKSGGAVLVAGAVLVLVGLPFGSIWLSEPIDRPNPETGHVERLGYRWPAFSPWQVESSPPSFLDGWAEWNFTGYEGKPAYREYHDIVTAMEAVGEEHGCGRALWEYDSDLDRYGTPMALMLLPYWTDGCIGSMEGLFFESSMTTPFHFLMQTELSANPSSAQRNMPYHGFDFALGVRHLQLMGVRYYMVTSPQATLAARDHPDLDEVAISGPWEVYEVADSDLVTPLSYEPAVLSSGRHNAEDWVETPLDEHGRYFGPAVQWFLDPTAWDVPLSLGGPGDWQRVGLGEAPERRRLPEAQVSSIDAGRDSISFEVDEPGRPVLVKASYFPNWQARGADGPWRVAPNLMVVIPTEREVELRYANTPVEWLAYGLTAAGLVGLVLLARRGSYQLPERSG